MNLKFLPESCLLSVFSISVVLAKLPIPRNVRVKSVNMGAILEWERPNNSLENLTYTAEYSSPVAGYFSPVCRNLSQLWCDFTQVINPFGNYTFRVRAELRGDTSEWKATRGFLPDQHTLIGGPKLRLVSREGNLEVYIDDPVLKIRDLRQIYSSVGYNITYWKEGEEDKATMMNNMQQNNLVLNRLAPFSLYCVQARVFIADFRKTGDFSQVACHTTTTDGKVEMWMIALVLLMSFLVVSVTLPLLFLGAWYFYRGLKFLYPNANLPEHLKKYLMEPPQHYIFTAMQDSSQLEEQYQEVSIISESSLVEEGEPCGRTGELNEAGSSLVPDVRTLQLCGGGSADM
ncbi:hypothetical protein GJAV_G00207610 [Gymnothorax javanicus]|nr:hypothetical protein GJAV_G00207610 [Gymnothorax javanicus]